jgi:polyisoprenoid-binding protein YceI
MNIRRTASLLTLGLAVSLILGLAPMPQTKPVPAAPAAKSGVLVIDPVHSSTVFKIKHVNVTNFYGRFNQIGGKLTFDEANPASIAVEVEVKTASVDTNNAARDTHVKSPDFFDVEKFPTATFKSTQAKKTGDHTYEVSGDLTFHGVTKPITIQVQHTGTADHPQMGHVVGFETTFTIKRSDFGVNMGVKEGALGDEVTLTFSLEAAPPKN